MQRYAGVLLALGACLAGLVIALLAHEHAPGHRRHTRGGAPGDPSLTSIHDIGTMMRIMRYLDQDDLVNLSRVDRHNHAMAQSVRKVVPDALRKARSYNYRGVHDFSPDGQKVLHETYDTTSKTSDFFSLTVSTLSQPTEQPVVLKHPGFVFGNAIFSPDGETVASWDNSATLNLFDINSGQHRLEMELERYGPMAFSPTGAHLAIGDSGVGLSIYSIDPSGGATLNWTFAIYNVEFYRLSYSADGTKILVQGGNLQDDTDDDTDEDNPVLYIVDTNIQKVVYIEFHHDTAVFSFSPDSKSLLRYGSDYILVQHEEVDDQYGNITYNRGLFEKSEDISVFTSAAFSPDMLTIVSGTNQGELSVWNVASSGLELLQTVNLGKSIHMIKFSTNGDLLNVAAGTKCFQYTTPLLLPPQERIREYIDS